MTPTPIPQNVQKVGPFLAVAWSDGSETFLPLETLRRHCPCATCGGEPDVTGRVERPEISYTERSFDLVSWEMVGGYGLQPRWGDGHSTGIYPFAFLRKLGEISP